MMMIIMIVVVVVVVVVVIIIIIIIALHGAIQDVLLFLLLFFFFFFFFLQSPHCPANCLQHVRSSGQGAIVCKSRSTHPALITGNMQCATWYKGTAQLLDFTEMKSHLA